MPKPFTYSCAVQASAKRILPLRDAGSPLLQRLADAVDSLQILSRAAPTRSSVPCKTCNRSEKHVPANASNTLMLAPAPT